METEYFFLIFLIFWIVILFFALRKYHSCKYCHECKRKTLHEVIDADDRWRGPGQKLKRHENLRCMRYKKHPGYRPTISDDRFKPPEKHWPLI